MASASRNTDSSMVELDLVKLHNMYNIDPAFQLEVPKTGETVFHPPAGRICLYEECFKAGLRVPLHAFVVALLLHLGLAPGALTPNSWRYICGFIAACKFADAEPTCGFFHHLFSVKHARGDGDQGWYYVTQRGWKGIRLLIQGAPSSIHGWKNRFFYVSRSDGVEWGFPSWGSLPISTASVPPLDRKEQDDLRKLDNFSVPDLRELLSEETLFSVGLSLTKPERVEIAEEEVAAEVEQPPEVVADTERPPRGSRRRRTGEAGSRRTRARISASSSSTAVPESGALVLASPASASSEDEDKVPLSRFMPSPAELSIVPLDSQELQVAIIPPPAGVILIEEINSPELEAGLDEAIPVEVVPAEAVATEGISAERPALPKGKEVIPGDCSGLVGKGLLLEASALHDYELAEEALKGILYPADAEELLRKSDKLLRKDIVNNVFRTIHYLNHLCERSVSLKREAKRWEDETMALRGFKKKAALAANELRGENNSLQEEVDAGVKAIRDSRVEVVTLEAQLEALTAARLDDQRAMDAQAAKIEELEATCAAAIAQTEKLKAECAAATSQAARIEELEAKCATAEERANSAVADFRKSQEFEDEKIEYSTFAYSTAVTEIQRRVTEKYPNIDWGLVLASSDGEDSDSPPCSTPPAS